MFDSVNRLLDIDYKNEVKTGIKYLNQLGSKSQEASFWEKPWTENQTNRYHYKDITNLKYFFGI